MGEYERYVGKKIDVVTRMQEGFVKTSEGFFGETAIAPVGKNIQVRGTLIEETEAGLYLENTQVYTGTFYSSLDKVKSSTTIPLDLVGLVTEI